jgi:hypothetical protein
MLATAQFAISASASKIIVANLIKFFDGLLRDITDVNTTTICAKAAITRQVIFANLLRYTAGFFGTLLTVVFRSSLSGRTLFEARIICAMHEAATISVLTLALVTVVKADATWGMLDRITLRVLELALVPIATATIVTKRTAYLHPAPGMTFDMWYVGKCLRLAILGG